MIGVVAAPLALAAVLGVEVQLARRGTNLPDDTPLDLDVAVGRPGLSMVWLGDSTAAGVGASDAAHAIPAQVARALGGAVQIRSLAVSGDTVGDVVADQLPQLREDPADVVLISIGANDVTHLTSRADFRRRYDQIVDALPEGALLVILGVPDMGAPPRLAQPLRAVAGLRGRQLDDVVRDVARDAGALYVDIAGETGPTMRSDTARYFAPDRYHPSDDGYALWADAVLKVLRPALPSPQEVLVADR